MKLREGKFCPRCGSENFVGSVVGNLMAGTTNSDILKCKDCEYEGIFPSGKIDKIKNIQKKIKKINKVKRQNG